MEAIVKISGKQYRVAEGSRVTVDRLSSKVGDEVSFGDVLLLADGAKATVGQPLVDGAAVKARVVASTRGPKIVVYKYKAKKRYRRTRGARADLSLLEVISVSGPGSKRAAAKTAAEAPAKPASEAAPQEKPATPRRAKAETAPSAGKPEAAPKATPKTDAPAAEAAE